MQLEKKARNLLVGGAIATFGYLEWERFRRRPSRFGQCCQHPAPVNGQRLLHAQDTRVRRCREEVAARSRPEWGGGQDAVTSRHRGGRHVPRGKL